MVHHKGDEGKKMDEELTKACQAYVTIPLKEFFSHA